MRYLAWICFHTRIVLPRSSTDMKGGGDECLISVEQRGRRVLNELSSFWVCVCTYSVIFLLWPGKKIRLIAPFPRIPISVISCMSFIYECLIHLPFQNIKISIKLLNNQSINWPGDCFSESRLKLIWSPLPDVFGQLLPSMRWWSGWHPESRLPSPANTNICFASPPSFHPTSNNNALLPPRPIQELMTHQACWQCPIAPAWLERGIGKAWRARRGKG